MTRACSAPRCWWCERWVVFERSSAALAAPSLWPAPLGVNPRGPRFERSHLSARNLLRNLLALAWIASSESPRAEARGSLWHASRRVNRRGLKHVACFGLARFGMDCGGRCRRRSAAKPERSTIGLAGCFVWHYPPAKQEVVAGLASAHHASPSRKQTRCQCPEDSLRRAQPEGAAAAATAKVLLPHETPRFARHHPLALRSALDPPPYTPSHALT
jgi:hypothetical protein